MSELCPDLRLAALAGAIAPGSIGVSLGGRPFDASDPVAMELENRQFVLGEGPITDMALGTAAATDMVGVSGPDAVSEAWPSFGEHLTDRSIGAVFSFPVSVDRHSSFGTLTLYRTGRGPLAEADRRSVLGAGTRGGVDGGGPRAVSGSVA